MALICLESLPRRTTKGDLLQFLCATGGMNREQVGRIDLRGTIATIEVPPDRLVRLVKALDGARLKDRHVRARSLAEADVSFGNEHHFQRLARLLELES